MKISIIGAGNTGFACAAHLIQKGYDVTVYTRNSEKAAYLDQKQITSGQFYSGVFSVSVTADLNEALKGADLLIVCTWANAHHEIFEKIYAQTDCNILIFNGNWGAYEAYQVRSRFYPKSEKCIAETGGMPYVASFSVKDRSLSIKGIKRTVTIAGVNGFLSDSLLALLHSLYEDVQTADSVLTTSLEAPNPIIHIPLSLFNLSRIEHHESFSLLTEGFSERASEYIRGIDRERAALADRLGVSYENITKQLNSFWGTSYPTLSELFAGNPVYQNVKAPDSISHRFIAEDLPYGIEPLVSLGTAIGVETPYSNALTDTFYLYLQKKEHQSVRFDTRLLQNV